MPKKPIGPLAIMGAAAIGIIIMLDEVLVLLLGFVMIFGSMAIAALGWIWLGPLGLLIALPLIAVNVTWTAIAIWFVHDPIAWLEERQQNADSHKVEPPDSGDEIPDKQ
ncbi:MAG: hypothetical protein ACIAXF_09510 [Phycisphaerales bacterium JB063]